jgi:hypothetical protein
MNRKSKILALWVALAFVSHEPAYSAGESIESPSVWKSCKRVLSEVASPLGAYTTLQNELWISKQGARFFALSHEQIAHELELYWAGHKEKSTKNSQRALLNFIRKQLLLLYVKKDHKSEPYRKILFVYAEVLEKEGQWQEAAWHYYKLGHLKRAQQLEKDLSYELRRGKVVSKVEIAEDTANPTFVITFSSGVKGLWKPKVNFSMNSYRFDSGSNEVFAYNIDRELGFYRVPVTVLRNGLIPLKTKTPTHVVVKYPTPASKVLVIGTIQAFVEGVSPKILINKNSKHSYVEELKNKLALFDYLIGNPDRHIGYTAAAGERMKEVDNEGNLLVSHLTFAQERLIPVAIDHHRILVTERKLRHSQHFIPLEEIKFPIDKREYDSIRSFDFDAYIFPVPLDINLIKEIQTRQKAIVEYIEGKRRKLGDSVVFGSQ